VADKPNEQAKKLNVASHLLQSSACSFGWWLMAGADLF
jgi:hypothetical protein